MSTHVTQTKQYRAQLGIYCLMIIEARHHTSGKRCNFHVMKMSVLVSQYAYHKEQARQTVNLWFQRNERS